MTALSIEALEEWPADAPQFTFGSPSEVAPVAQDPIPVTVPEPEPEPALLSSAKFYDGYSRTPTYVDQYERLPNTVKEGELQARVYDLMQTEQLAQYNKLLAESTCPYSPRVIMTKVDTQTYEGSWKVLAHFKPLWYKTLHK